MSRLQKVEEQIKGLGEIRDTLISLIKNCEDNSSSRDCPLIKTLQTYKKSHKEIP